MADFRYQRSVQTKLRYRAALVCAALGLVLMLVAVRFETKEFLVSSPGERHAERVYSRMWFDGADALVGTVQQGSRLTIDRWEGGGPKPRTWQFDLGTPDAQWTLAPDLSRVAWISGSTLYSQLLPQQNEPNNTGVFMALPPGRNPLALTLLSDGSVAGVFADSSVERWDGATLHPAGTGHLELKEVDQAAAEGDSIAVASNRSDRLLLYRFREAKEWKLEEISPSPDPPYQLIVPPPGLMAAITPSGLRIGGKLRHSPGALRSVVARVDNMIATGDFDGVVVLPAEGEPYSLAEAAPGSIVSASATQLAVSGGNGTSLFTLKTERRLTSKGRALSRAAVGLLLLAGLLASLGLVRRVRDGLSGRVRRGRAPLSFGEPPSELVKACLCGEGVLWAGAGLSAQSGFPARSDFIASVLQMASVDRLIDAAHAQKILGRYKRGETEDALDQIVAKIGSRDQLFGHYHAVFSRLSLLSRSHELLAQVPFGSAVTTNYDLLLERMGERWGRNVLTLRSGRPSQGAGMPFLLKLYGNLADLQTVLLSRFEFHSVVPHSAAPAILGEVFARRTVFFVGCSLEGLLADLSKLSLPDPPTRKHFALAGVSDASWKSKAARLSGRYGIEVLASDADHVRAALPEFLEKLVQEIDRVRLGVQPAVASVR